VSIRIRVKFISYAVWMGSARQIQAAIARHGRPVRVRSTDAEPRVSAKTTTLLKEKLGGCQPPRDWRVRPVDRGSRAVALVAQTEAVRSTSDPRRRRNEPDGTVRTGRAGTDRCDTDGEFPERGHRGGACDSLPPRDAKLLRLYFG